VACVFQGTGVLVRPNGLALAPDGRSLYVSDTGATHVAGGPRCIRRFDVGAGGALSGGAVYAALTEAEGLFDGFRLDEAGRVWTSAGECVHVYAPDGGLLLRVHVGRKVSNVCWGGPKRNRLRTPGDHWRVRPVV
jgi:gluconolactonase